MSRPEEMSCRELVERVTDYLEGRLDQQEVGRLEAHLADCEYCATYVEQFGTTMSALRNLEELSMLSETREELLEAFRGRRAP